MTLMTLRNKAQNEDNQDRATTTAKTPNNRNQNTINKHAATESKSKENNKDPKIDSATPKPRRNRALLRSSVLRVEPSKATKHKTQTKKGNEEDKHTSNIIEIKAGSW